MDRRASPAGRSAQLYACTVPASAAHLPMRRQDRIEQKPRGTSMAATRIDCDIHPAVGGTRTTLLPYLDDHWKEQVVSRAIDGLDLNSYPPNMPFSGRADWRPAQANQAGQAGQRACDGAARRVRPARREPRDLQRASTARRPCSIPIWQPTSARRSTTGSRPSGLQRIRGSARLDRGADAGAGSRGGGNRAARR